MPPPATTPVGEIVFDSCKTTAQPHWPAVMKPNLCQRFSAAPLELRIYAVFSILVTLLGIALPMVGPRKLWEAVVPFTGWSPALGYMFSLYFTLALIYTKIPAWTLRIGVFAPLTLEILFGLRELSAAPTPNFGNPFLTVSPWRPVWTIVLPAIWMGVVLSPRITRFSALPPSPPNP